VGIAEFLVKVSADPKQLAKFRKNPAAALRKARLTAEERKAILSGSARRLRTTIGFASWGRGKVK
jgi:hypothetical protein